jgi:hypothetical protein
MALANDDANLVDLMARCETSRYRARTALALAALVFLVVPHQQRRRCLCRPSSGLFLVRETPVGPAHRTPLEEERSREGRRFWVRRPFETRERMGWDSRATPITNF